MNFVDLDLIAYVSQLGIDIKQIAYISSISAFTILILVIFVQEIMKFLESL